MIVSQNRYNMKINNDRFNMKMNHRRFCAIAFPIILFALLLTAYNELNYLALREELEELKEASLHIMNKFRNLTSNQKNTTISSNQKNYSNYASGLVTVFHGHTPRDMAMENIVDENKFQDMYKYTKFNTNFREYTVWPPDVVIPDQHITVSEIKNTSVEPDMPNWQKFNLQIDRYFLYEEDSPVVEDMLHDILTQKITAVERINAGMQFHLLVTFENGGKALFKPQRYPKDQEVQPNILYFSDFERHYSEIAAYHLDRIIGFRRVPPVIGRKVSITKELYKLADTEFLNTFYYSPDGNYCFEGICLLYCDSRHGFCGDPDLIEGSFSAWLVSEPRQFLHKSIIRSPWRRTYVTNEKAPWEVNNNFCSQVVRKMHPFNLHRRLYDVMDCAIFDYLIGNMDRHNFDELLVFGNRSVQTMLHIDNGRGFGRSDHDEESILRPLMQCCEIRLSTFNKLYSFYMGPHLSDLMRESLKKDPLSPILTERHLQALDRRVENALDAVRRCLEVNTPARVFLDDM